MLIGPSRTLLGLSAFQCSVAQITHSQLFTGTLLQHGSPSSWAQALLAPCSMLPLRHWFPGIENNDTYILFPQSMPFHHLLRHLHRPLYHVPRHLGNHDPHPVQSLFTGTFPMGAITILNIAVSLIHEDYGFGGKPFLYVLWAFWWLDVISSFLCCFGVMHFM